jgi:DHA1 family inner membrane transport protein
MSTQQTVLRPGKANLVLATLFLGMFVLGSAELLVVGVLNLIAADLQISIPTAGTLVTAYALGPSSSARSFCSSSATWSRC